MRFRFLTLIPDAGSLAKAARILEYLIICCYNDTITVDDSDEDFYMKLIADYSMPSRRLYHILQESLLHLRKEDELHHLS